MGDFLSTPNKDKHSIDNENNFIKYGACGMQGWRKRMEDAHISDISKGPNQSLNVFGVFDGHGGKEIAQYVSHHFTEEVVNSNSYKSGNLKSSLQESFLKMDVIMQTREGKEEIKKYAKQSKEEDDQQNKKEPSNNQMELFAQMIPAKDPDSDEIAMRTGCTSCVCAIDEKEKKMYFANAGDSRVVLYKSGKAFPMSIDHKPELESEKNRIYKADGWINDGRVKGNLNLTRGFGDLEYKQNKSLSPEEQMITSNPDIVIEPITPDTDFIVIGCDGIWDCLTNIQACEFISTRIKEDPNRRLSSILEEMMDSIVAKDLYNESGVGCDNMTCIVVAFKK